MRIQPINQFYPNFKSNDNNVYEDDRTTGFDDSVSRTRREYIRDNYRTYTMPYYEIIENSGRLDEYQLNSLLASLLGQNVSKDSLSGILKAHKEYMTELRRPRVEDCNRINKNIIKDAYLSNMQPIEGSSSYRGCTPLGAMKSLQYLKEAGIKTVVDLVGYSHLKGQCEEVGLDYLAFPLNFQSFRNAAFTPKEKIVESALKYYRDIVGLDEKQTQTAVKQAISKWGQEKREFIEDFKTFIKTMQKENVYIGCECGTIKTDNALMLNYFFNPYAQDTDDCITIHNRGLLEEVQVLYNNLTPKDKAELGWTEGFDEYFNDRVENRRCAYYSNQKRR